MIEFTSVIRMLEKQTPLSLDWANKKIWNHLSRYA